VQFAVPAEHYDRFMGRYAPALADTAGVTPECGSWTWAAGLVA